MRVRLKARLAIVTAESDEERRTVSEWASHVDGHVFGLVLQNDQTFRLTSLGPRADACREPINVSSRATDPAIRLISNFAHTPFELDGEPYASVEGFWQGLKFQTESTRRAIAQLHGDEARRAGFGAPAAEAFEYRGHAVRVGTADHRDLMFRACWEKFRQHGAAREALMATRARPLQHRTRRDSRTIPGVVMADIWMRIRTRLGTLQSDDRRPDSARPDADVSAAEGSSSGFHRSGDTRPSRRQ